MRTDSIKQLLQTLCAIDNLNIEYAETVAHDEYIAIHCSAPDAPLPAHHRFDDTRMANTDAVDAVRSPASRVTERAHNEG